MLDEKSCKEYCKTNTQVHKYTNTLTFLNNEPGSQLDEKSCKEHCSAIMAQYLHTQIHILLKNILIY